MTAAMTAPKPAPTPPAISLAPAPEPSDHSPAAVAEERRWLFPLAACFTFSAAFFAAAIGSGLLWLLAPAGLGIGLIIVGFVYLGLTSDTNSSQ